jgi:hypothetical protein
MLSYQEIMAEHSGQWEAGKTIDWLWSGRRKMTTFKKLPTTRPRRPAAKRRKDSGIMVAKLWLA